MKQEWAQAAVMPQEKPWAAVEPQETWEVAQPLEAKVSGVAKPSPQVAEPPQLRAGSQLGPAA